MAEIDTINMPTSCDPRDSPFERPNIDLYHTRITETANKPSDYVNLKRDGRTATLELSEPLFHAAITAAENVELERELSAVLAAIGPPVIEEIFTSIIAEYANSLLSSPEYPVSIGLSVAACLLKELVETNRLRFGLIIQIPEGMPEGMNLVEDRDEHPVVEYAE